GDYLGEDPQRVLSGSAHVRWAQSRHAPMSTAGWRSESLYFSGPAWARREAGRRALPSSRVVSHDLGGWAGRRAERGDRRGGRGRWEFGNAGDGGLVPVRVAGSRHRGGRNPGTVDLRGRCAREPGSRLQLG